MSDREEKPEHEKLPAAELKISVEPKSGKKVAPGISYSRWMWFPTCNWCGLEDAGPEGGERPTETHMLGCKSRNLMKIPQVQVQVGYDKDKKPVLEWRDRPGMFIGEALVRQLRYPFRRAFKFKERDRKTSILTGRELFFCEYLWKTQEGVADWCWTGTKWVPWYEFSGTPKPKFERHPLSQSEIKWLSMFFRKP